MRAQDIPELLADGAADVGVTGWDLVSECGRELEQLLDLDFGRCRLVVAAQEDAGITKLAELTAGTRVATSFPRLTRRFFEGLGRKVEVVAMSGSVEIAPHLGIADVVVDLTSTGSTLAQNGLRELATVRGVQRATARASGHEGLPRTRPRRWTPSRSRSARSSVRDAAAT